MRQQPARAQLRRNLRDQPGLVRDFQGEPAAICGVDAIAIPGSSTISPLPAQRRRFSRGSRDEIPAGRSGTSRPCRARLLLEGVTLLDGVSGGPFLSDVNEQEYGNGLWGGFFRSVRHIKGHFAGLVDGFFSFLHMYAVRATRYLCHVF